VGQAVIVTDTNLIVYLLIASPHSARAEEVYRRDPHWVAPSLWRSEFRNVLAFYLRRKQLALEEAVTRMNAAESLMESQEFGVTSARVLELSAASGCSAYDCEFVALAESLGAPLVSSDRQVLAKFKPRAISPEAFCAR
jgi:predicted nucleic acid-binding protein